jgi:hypothetical protein
MPRAHQPAAINPTVGHRGSQMGAELTKRRHLPVVAGPAQHQANPVDLDPLRLPVLQRLHRQPVRGAQPLTGLVDADTRVKHQRPTQVASADCDAITDGANHNSPTVPAAAPIQPGHDVEAGRQTVQHTMHQPDAAVFLMRVLPIRDTGNRGPQIGQDSQPQRTGSES